MDPPRSDTPPTLVAIAVVRYKGRVLVGQRPPGSHLEGLWEFPGGKVRPGEPPERAATRECQEETGLRVRIDALYAEVDYTYNYGPLRLLFFEAQPIDPCQLPMSPYRWVPIAELSASSFPPANATVIARLIQEDRPRGT